MEENGKVDDIIWVRSGSLRVDKQLTFEDNNICPSSYKDERGRVHWDLNRVTKEKRITTLIIKANKFFGLYEVNNDINFEQGKLIVNEDDTYLCYIDRAIFMTNLSEKEIDMLVQDKKAYVEYPLDEEMQVKVAGEKKMRKLVADSLLESLKFSGNPHFKNGRLFDMQLVRESPTKT